MEWKTRQIVAVLIANVSSIHTGIFFYWLITMMSQPNDNNEDPFLTRLPFLCTLLVLPLIAYISERFGRRIAIVTIIIPYDLFFMTLLMTNGYEATYGNKPAMIFAGIACGMQSYVVPMYVYEISSHNRIIIHGAIGSILMTIGLLAGYFRLVERSFKTPMFYGCSLLFSQLFLYAWHFCPESPLWLAMKGRTSQAITSAKRLNITIEPIPLPETLDRNDDSKNQTIRKSCTIVIILFFVQAAGQMNYALGFLYELKNSVLSDDNDIFRITIILIFFISMWITIELYHKIRPRRLLMICCIGMAITFGLEGGLAYLPRINLTSCIQYFSTFPPCVFAICGIVTIPSVIAAIPQKFSSHAYTISVGVFWIFVWIIAKTWWSSTKNTLPYWGFSNTIISVVLLIFVYYYVLETKPDPVGPMGYCAIISFLSLCYFLQLACIYELGASVHKWKSWLLEKSEKKIPVEMEIPNDGL